MAIAIDITFRGMDPNSAVEAVVRDKIAWLERFSGRIMACRVVVEPSHGRHRAGNPFRVRIDVTLPGREIVVRRDPPQAHAHEALDVAIRDAFDAARRRLEDFERERRGDVKPHLRAGRALVAHLFPESDHGFLETADGRQVYFHRNAVQGAGFDALETGLQVSYREESGIDGPQAVFVRPTRRRVPGPTR